MGGADQLRSATEFCASAGRSDLGCSLASPNQSAGIGLSSHPGVNRHGFAGEHGLVEENVSRDQARICWNDAAEREFNNVAGHQIGGGDTDPDAIPADRGRQREARLQGRQSMLRPSLLHQADDSVERQQTSDHSGLDVFAEPEFEYDRGLQHPRYGRPELFQRAPPRMLRSVRNTVGAEAL